MKEVGEDFIRGLQAYDLPGNVLELQNIVERVMNTCQDERLSYWHIPEDICYQGKGGGNPEGGAGAFPSAPFDSPSFTGGGSSDMGDGHLSSVRGGESSGLRDGDPSSIRRVAFPDTRDGDPSGIRDSCPSGIGDIASPGTQGGDPSSFGDIASPDTRGEDPSSFGDSAPTGSAEGDMVKSIREQCRERADAHEKRTIQALLKRYDGNVAKVAREMGISRNTLYRKLNKYKMR